MRDRVQLNCDDTNRHTRAPRGAASGYETQDCRATDLFEIPPEMLYKQSTSITYVEGFESVSDIGNVRAEMERRGYTTEEIAKVFGGNWMRLFREAWNS
jgi:microsomal dipeptidase-like Zn-dependent dipeptidase